jgi:hypothetical protein
MNPEPSRKKRVRPARKIVARGQMGPQWVIAPLVLGAIIVILGVVYLLTR